MQSDAFVWSNKRCWNRPDALRVAEAVLVSISSISTIYRLLRSLLVARGVNLYVWAK